MVRSFSWMLVLLVAGLFGSPVYSQSESIAQDPVKLLIHDIGLTGCVVIYDQQTDTTIVYGDPLADSSYTPASTFKIPHALIALQLGVVSDTTTFAWDGIERGWDMWDRDMTFADALHYSAIFLFQKIAPQIGEERMAQWVKRLDYGNNDISGQIDLFWVDGGLRATPIQQIDFLKRMVNGELPINQQHIDFVANSILTGTGEGWSAHAKTGRAIRHLPQVGWYVGWIEYETRAPVYFATILLDKEDGPRIKRPRKDITEAALRHLNLIAPTEELPYY